jgi:patatin-like phospholipase/acyl hydrolase
MSKVFDFVRANVCTLFYVSMVVTAFATFFKEDAHSYVGAVTIVDPGKAALDVALEVIRFAITLNTAIIAAAAALSVKGADWISDWGIDSSLLVTLTLVGCALSYYGAYSAFSVLLEMSQMGGVDPASDVFAKALAVQYYSALASAIILGASFVRFLDRRHSAKAGHGDQANQARGAVAEEAGGARSG